MRRVGKTVCALSVIGLGFILVCRLNQAAADFYAMKLYPAISAALSLVASVTEYSLTEITAILLLMALLALPILALMRRIRWKRALWDMGLILAGAVVWLYLGWGTNYFRSSLYERRGVQPAAFDRQKFEGFLAWYSQALEDNLKGAFPASVPKGELEEEIKDFYRLNAFSGGLCLPRSYQHPKRLILEDMYAGVGVLGYIGPFFTEHHVSGKLLDMEYPYTLAHEYAHVLGVSEEAEANYWAFSFCMASENPSVRYSALQGILSQVMSNARTVLDEAEYAGWMKTVPSRALDDFRKRQAHWKSLYWPVLGRIQEFSYDLFLKGNRIDGGMENYGRVIGMILTFDSDKMRQAKK